MDPRLRGGDQGRLSFPWVGRRPMTTQNGRLALCPLAHGTTALVRPASLVRGSLRRASLVEQPRSRPTALAHELHDLCATETRIYSRHIQW